MFQLIIKRPVSGSNKGQQSALGQSFNIAQSQPLYL